MTTLPIPPSTILTPRLKLVRLTDTTPGSRDVQLFHENWSDAVATGWSLHGATKSLAESRAWMLHQLHEYDTWFYAVFTLDDEGQHLGSVSLRHMPKGTELPPPASFDGAGEVGTGAPLSAGEVEEREAVWRARELRMRVLGYALFESAHGRGYATEACKGLIDGYATEACKGLIDGYRESVGVWRGSEQGRDKGETVFYVEAGVDRENLGSQRVLGKLGFRTVGLKVEKERVWLNGGWRGPGWWITGMYV